MGDNVVDEPEGERLGGVDEVAGEAHLPGAAHADRLGEQHRHPPRRHDAEPGVGVAELGALGRHEEVAVQRQFEPAGHRGAVDRPDQRLAQRRKRPAAAPALRFQRSVDEPAAAFRRQLGEVEPGAERRVGAGEDDHVDVVVGVGGGEQLREQAQHVAGQGVAGLRPVERDRGDALGDVEQHRLASTRSSTVPGGYSAAESSAGRKAKRRSPRRTSVDATQPPRAPKCSSSADDVPSASVSSASS